MMTGQIKLSKHSVEQETPVSANTVPDASIVFGTIVTCCEYVLGEFLNSRIVSRRMEDVTKDTDLLVGGLSANNDVESHAMPPHLHGELMDAIPALNSGWKVGRRIGPRFNFFVQFLCFAVYLLLVPRGVISGASLGDGVWDQCRPEYESVDLDRPLS